MTVLTPIDSMLIKGVHCKGIIFMLWDVVVFQDAKDNFSALRMNLANNSFERTVHHAGAQLELLLVPALFTLKRKSRPHIKP